MILKKIVCISLLCFPLISNAESYQNNQNSNSVTNNSIFQLLPQKQEYLDTYRLATMGNAQAQLKFAQYYSDLGYLKSYRLFKEELYWYKKAAEQGLPEAQLKVSLSYQLGIPYRDNEEYLKWLLKAANQDYPKAQHELAGVYLSNWGDNGTNLKNEVEALKWLNKAIENYLKNLNTQDPQQLYELSACYFDASELTSNPKNKKLLENKGFYYLNQAVALDSHDAAIYLANKSPTLPLDKQKVLYQKAFEILVKTAKKGDPNSQNTLGKLYLYQSAIFYEEEKIKKFINEIKYDGERIEENPTKAFYWLNEAYKNSKDKSVASNLIHMYLLGKGTEKNYLKALELRKVLSKTNVDHLYYLAQMYLSDLNPLKDDRKGLEILLYISEEYHKGFSDLTDHGYYYDYEKNFIASSQAELGRLYLYGIGTDKDYEKAIYWINKAANQKNFEAFHLLGKIYYYGYGVAKNQKTAFDYFIKAISIDKHDSDSYYFIGYMYEHGQGVAKNYGKALEHYKIAADLEHESAKKALINLTQIMYK